MILSGQTHTFRRLKDLFDFTCMINSMTSDDGVDAETFLLVL